MDSASAIQKHEYRVRDLPTRTVTLFASRAQVVRDIKNIPLKPGVNEITIVGLTPTIDEQSIKVEGTGSAIITDIAVESLPNREIFEEIYPDSDDDRSSDSDLDTDSEELPEPISLADVPESDALKAVRTKLTSLRDELGRTEEILANTESRQKWLDAYYKTMADAGGFGEKAAKEINVGEAMGTYDGERKKVFAIHMEAKVRKREICDEINEITKEETKLAKDCRKEMTRKEKERQKILKARAKARKLKEKEKEKERRKEAERQKEKARIRKERESFWPKSCFTVRIKLEAVEFTPMSSRRSSFVGDVVKAVPDKSPADETATPGSCDLSLTYVTAYAYWSPKYDLQLSTTNNAGLLCFDAELTNLTSETWSDCKVTLSTSQTTTTSLNELIPTLVPWHVKLAGRHAALGNNFEGSPNGDILNSREEREHKQSWQQRNNIVNVVQKPRGELFGPQSNSAGFSKAHKGFANHFLSSVQPPPPPQAAPQAASQAALFGAANKNSAAGGAFGQSTGFGQATTSTWHATEASAPRASHFGSLSKKVTVSSKLPKLLGEEEGTRTRRGLGNAPGGNSIEDEEYSDSGSELDVVPEIDEMTLNPSRELDFQESSFEETGLTTTYDLPGVKTLVPSPIASKQRVARIQFASVVFSHTVVAKYCPAAYLKAKMKNGSKITLLKGPTGLTLDGSFMGRTTLPRCSAGESFTLPLGVDPAIKVAYPKPDIQRLTTGFFAKEDSSIYTRTVTIANTRSSAGKPVNVLVLDQVPVSEDEKLRIEVLSPKGLSVGGNAVLSGIAIRDGEPKKDWGKATTQLKKGGEITWEVHLNAGKAVKLVLEYGVALPTGEKVMQC